MTRYVHRFDQRIHRVSDLIAPVLRWQATARISKISVRYYSVPSSKSVEKVTGPLNGIKILDLSRVLAVSLKTSPSNNFPRCPQLTDLDQGPILYSDSRRLWCRHCQSRSCWEGSEYTSEALHTRVVRFFVLTRLG